MSLTISKVFGIILFVEATEATNGGRMAELLEAIGHNIRRLRDEKGWNQTELGFRAGASASIISLIENGKRNPSTATLAKIAEALGVEVVDLFPKGPSSSPEPTLLNGLDDERRFSRFSEAIITAAERWGEAVSSPEMADSRRFGFIDAALGLSDVISESVEGEEDWEAIPNRERLELVTTAEKLTEVATRGIRCLEESAEAREQEEQVNQRREQMREVTRRIERERRTA
jgi:transcriptional regulator with XRE-family HTH domain